MKALIVGNWKQYIETDAEIANFFKTCKYPYNEKVSVVLCPGYTHIQQVIKKAKKLHIDVGAQDVSGTDIGAHTGEVSAKSLADISTKYAIVGHSELRDKGLTDTEVNAKIRMALHYGIRPIICIGEKNVKDRYAVLERQLESALQNVTEAQLKQCIIAYEPIAFIGASHSMDADTIRSTTLYIKDIVRRISPSHSFAKMIVIYGGAVDETSAHHILDEGGVDGLLIGRASSDGVALAKLCKALQ